MNRLTGHPDDLSPYLDHDSLDPRCKEIELHLDTCSQCRNELHRGQSMEALFRAGRDEIEVPPFQWQRIAAQLQTPLPLNSFARVRLLPWPWKPAWNVTLAAVILSVALLAGLEYHKNYEEKQLLLAVSRYAAAEQLRLGSEENPFRTATISDRTDESNPFAIRR
jgi:anti-sigma factor RsiW